MSGVINLHYNRRKVNEILAQYMSICEDGARRGVLREVKRTLRMDDKTREYIGFDKEADFENLSMDERLRYEKAIEVIEFIHSHKARARAEGRLGEPDLPDFLSHLLLPVPSSSGR